MNALHRTLQKLVDEAVEKQKHKNIQRWIPHFHVMPPVGWLNDPNGLCEYEGTYYAFFQMSPFEVHGGLKFWGLCTSKDLVHWEYKGAPLQPDQPYDCHGAYSGSALVEDGVMYVYYTGNVKLQGTYDYINNGRESNTVLAVSRDGKTFETKKLLMTNADYPWDLTCHVRDPKVWKQDDTYYMVQGARTKEDKGVVLVFSSEDKEHWKCIHRLQSEETFGFMWECPDLYELDGYTVLSISPQGLEADGWKYRNQYQTVAGIIHGDFRTDGVPGAFREIDGGFDFYAPQTFEDQQGRRILIGWMGIPDADYTNPTVKKGWQHALTIPRQLHIRDGKLYQEPVKELEKLCRNGRTFSKEEFQNLELPKCAKVQIDFKDCKNMEFSISDGVKLTYMDHVLTLDLGNCGSGRTIRKVWIEELTDLTLFADTTSLELFINKGSQVFTTRVYGKQGKAGLKGQCDARIQVYEMSGYEYGRI